MVMIMITEMIVYMILNRFWQVDVELAELEVLRGIDEHDWAKIHCVAIEVNDYK